MTARDGVVRPNALTRSPLSRVWSATRRAGAGLRPDRGRTGSLVDLPRRTVGPPDVPRPALSSW
ncbi:hypothetical protein C1701_06410 [Actinoalloteichus sp. AHMU CJ021]|nr:hypothetical protein C1701_06410 [Actinoalloteichus sp. AHMU CJ021]